MLRLCLVVLLSCSVLGASKVYAEKVGGLPTTGCTTAGVDRLARQLIGFHQERYNDDLVAVSNYLKLPNAVDLPGSRTNLVMTTKATRAFVAASEEFFATTGKSVRVISGFRSVVEQYMLVQGCAKAAKPGTSNHQGGIAVDISNHEEVDEIFAKHGFVNDVVGDKPHFNYRKGDDASATKKHTIQAFQLLWNISNPADKIDVDGLYGPQTEARIKASPAAGFDMQGKNTACTPGCYVGYGISKSCSVLNCVDSAATCRVIERDVACVTSPCSAINNGFVCVDDKRIRYRCKNGKEVESSECAKECGWKKCGGGSGDAGSGDAGSGDAGSGDAGPMEYDYPRGGVCSAGASEANRGVLFGLVAVLALGWMTRRRRLI